MNSFSEAETFFFGNNNQVEIRDFTLTTGKDKS